MSNYESLLKKCKSVSALCPKTLKRLSSGGEVKSYQITGSGLLFALSINNSGSSSTKYRNVKVKIDGESYDCFKFCVMDSLFSEDYGDSYYAVNAYPGSNKPSKGDGEETIDSILLTNPLRFNESIEIGTTSANVLTVTAIVALDKEAQS